MTKGDFFDLPPNLPVPVDDGACRHLEGMEVPAIELLSTRGRRVSLAEASRGSRVVVYVYPRTGRPGEALFPGWDAIPGARGCTPQSCGFRDRHDAFRKLGVEVFGLSTQDTDYQREMAGRLHLPFEVLSDAGLELTRALRLPTFEIEGLTLLKRLALVLRGGRIEKVFYPVFPPDENAANVVRWLEREAVPVLAVDHIQIAAPPGAEDAARRFYGAILGLRELPKPQPLSLRGGNWFVCGAQQVHIGIEKEFRPARKAHVAFRIASVEELDRLRARLESFGVPTRTEDQVEGSSRFYADDPWGNRLEFVADLRGS